MISKVAVLVLVVDIILADSAERYEYAPPASYQPEKEEKRPYDFEYNVKDDYAGTDFGHNEESDGNTVRGSYTVQLPDGRKQTVNYVADHYNGYNAEVSYYGEAQYPHEYGPPVTFKPQSYNSRPSYQPPSYQPPSYQPPTSYRPSYQ
ncbi:cuticle protein 7-like [Penaeus vannamei]|uniref:cuticle protein 7-like n=1 Tax=Penaeus vannamei TaxID=6689 RepID=UPI000F68EC63|nr:cuticle protein 7-like [Penaeus vannamei]